MSGCGARIGEYAWCETECEYCRDRSWYLQDCRNNPCVLHDGTGGQRTQGGCRHLREHPPTRMIQVFGKEILRLREELKTSKEAFEVLRREYNRLEAQHERPIFD